MDAGARLDAETLANELDWVRSLAATLVRDAAAADDLVQETVAAALAQRPRLERGARAWLAAVLRKQAALAARSASNRRAREERSAAAEAQPSAAELVARADSQRMLIDTVLSLSEPYRSVILLRFFEGLEPSAIAARHGVPAATVRSQLSRALAELRTKLDRRHDDDTRAWCAALAPWAFDGPVPSIGAGLPLATTLALFVMKYWIALSVCVVLATSMALVVREADFTGPESRAAAVSTAPSDLRGPDLGLAAVPVDPPSVREAASAEPAEQTVRQAPDFCVRVVDERTREPLTHFRVDVPLLDGEVESLVTDAEGRFVSTRTREPGPVTLTLLGDDGRVGVMRHDGALLSWNPGSELEVVWNGLDEVEVRLAKSPTLQLAFAPPAGLSTADFRAELYDFDPRSQPVERASFSMEAQVHGRPPFARFPCAHSSDSAPEERWLRLVSTNGLWHGWGRVPPDAFATNAPVAVELESAGRVQIELLSSNGEALAGASIVCTPLPNGRSLRRDANELGGARALASFDGLSTGTYRFVGRAHGMAELALELRVEPGSDARHTLVLEPLSETATIQGELRSRSGRFSDRVTLCVTRGPSDPAPRLAILEWVERDGEQVAPFRFEGLASGAYRFEIFEWTDDNHAWSPAPGPIEAPADHVVIVCDDVTPIVELVFRATAADTGEPLEGVALDLRAGERVLLPKSSSASDSVSCRVTGGTIITWSARREGFQDAAGSSAGAVREGEQWVCPVRLERLP